MDVRHITEEIVNREGGFVNDPSDRGGATKYGVTIHTMRRLNLDKNHDGRINSTDVRLLTKADAMDIFERHYFKGTNIHLLPRAMQATVYDMQVNAGGNAVKILQRLMGEFGVSLVVDGALGPNTARAVTKVYNKVGNTLIDAYGIARREYYFRIADRRPSQRKYFRSTRSGGKAGWCRRAEEFMSKKYVWTNAQFKRKVSKWA